MCTAPYVLVPRLYWPITWCTHRITTMHARSAKIAPESEPCGPLVGVCRSSFYDSYDSNAMRVQERDRPDWAGGGAASNIVNALINNQVLYGLMYVPQPKVSVEVPWHSIIGRWQVACTADPALMNTGLSMQEGWGPPGAD